MRGQGQGLWVGDLVGPNRGGSLVFKENSENESSAPGGEKHAQA